jgi:DNA (cytosine-5)-methyltransferase 1
VRREDPAAGSMVSGFFLGTGSAAGTITKVPNFKNLFYNPLPIGTMNELALFAGAGGGLLGTRLLGFRPVCAVELDPYRREILLRRQEEGHLEPFPVWDDVRTFCGDYWRARVDVLTAGFPCQPFSVAGQQRAENDPRNMWPDTIRIIREVEPRFCLLENVPGLKAKEYFGTILADLAESGYHTRWDCVRASDCGAPHRRDRLWLLADSSPIPIWEQSGGRRRAKWEGQAQLRLDGEDQNVAHPSSQGLEGQWQGTSSASKEESMSSGSGTNMGYSNQEGQLQQERLIKDIRRRTPNPSWWEIEPDVGRVAHGVARRVDRLGALGDGQVPAVVVRAWEILNRPFL